MKENEFKNIEIKIDFTDNLPNDASDDNNYEQLDIKKDEILDNNVLNYNEHIDLIDQIVNSIGITSYHFKIYSVISLFFLADGAEMIVISLIVSKLAIKWNLTISEKGFMGSSVFVGFFFGALMAGKFSDTRGRKPVYIIGSLIVGIFSLSSAFSPNYSLLIILRALNGFGIGMCIPSASSLAAEITPTKWRAYVLNIVWIFFPFGEIFAVLLAKEYIEEDYGWRILLALASIPAFIAFFMSFFIYESFRYYFSSNQFDKGFNGLNRLLKSELDDIRKNQIINQIKNKKETSNLKSEYSTLLNHDYLRITIKTCLIFYISSFVYYGIVYILPQTLETISKIKQDTIKEDIYFDIIISAVVEIPSTIVTGYIANIKFLGRIKSMMIGFGISALFSLLCSIYTSSISIWVSFLKFSIGIPFGIIYIYVVEAFPTKIRTIALGVTNSFTRLGGITTPIISQLAFSESITLPWALYSIISVIALIIAKLLPFETLGRNII